MSLYPIPLPARASAFVEAVGLRNSPTVAIPLPLVQLLGDWTAAAFLAQCMYHGSNAGDWFPKTHDDWHLELKLSADQVRRCLKTCAGLVDVKRQGIPARNYYHVNYAELASRLMGLPPVGEVAQEQAQSSPTASDWDTLPPVIQQPPQHSSFKKEQEQPRSRDDVQPLPSRHQQHLSRLLTTWNTHRGSLPEATDLPTSRQRALSTLLRDSGGDVEAAVNLLSEATSEVAQDPFWQEKRFGLDTLLPKVQGRAEAWRSRHPVKDNVCSGRVWVVGERVSYRREQYNIEAVTDTYLDLYDDLNGSVRVNYASDDIRAVRAVVA